MRLFKGVFVLAYCFTRRDFVIARVGDYKRGRRALARAELNS